MAGVDQNGFGEVAKRNLNMMIRLPIKSQCLMELLGKLIF